MVDVHSEEPRKKSLNCLEVLHISKLVFKKIENAVMNKLVSEASLIAKYSMFRSYWARMNENNNNGSQ